MNQPIPRRLPSGVPDSRRMPDDHVCKHTVYDSGPSYHEVMQPVWDAEQVTQEHRSRDMRKICKQVIRASKRLQGDSRGIATRAELLQDFAKEALARADDRMSTKADGHRIVALVLDITKDGIRYRDRKGLFTNALGDLLEAAAWAGNVRRGIAAFRERDMATADSDPVDAPIPVVPAADDEVEDVPAE